MEIEKRMEMDKMEIEKRMEMDKESLGVRERGLESLNTSAIKKVRDSVPFIPRALLKEIRNTDTFREIAEVEYFLRYYAFSKRVRQVIYVQGFSADTLDSPDEDKTLVGYTELERRRGIFLANELRTKESRIEIPFKCLLGYERLYSSKV